ncbi:hypothetical protein [Pleomorphomonas sp. PLEO]|uniref:hypothetical protein n=1 Tax=Pleomorphomonas sp. PLEO TaxID=3239306 RepID=UPI00351E7510
MIRSVVMLIAAFALLLALGPGPRAYAGGMGMGDALSAHQDADGCDPAMMSRGQSEKHDAGGCGKMHCCLGATCVFAGLPAAWSLLTPMSAAKLNLSPGTALLTGRDVSPPLDPPRPFA